jgi:hypothetical protein
LDAENSLGSHQSDDCYCNPTIIPVKRPDGSIGYVIAHKEASEDPAQLAERTMRIFEAIDEIRNST